MASQEFLASFAVEIDEGGAARLQEILSGNRELAESLASAFNAASGAIRSFAEELGLLPGFSAAGAVTEGLSGPGGLALGLDTAAAEKDLQSLIALAKKPVTLSANASGIVSAARTAYHSVKSLFSEPLTITANVEISGGDDPGTGGTVPRMSAGGRFAKPTRIEVAEDGDAEYIIPVKKEDRAIPLLRQLLAELSPAAKGELLTSGLNGQASWDGAPGTEAAGAGSLPDLSAGLSAGNVSAPSVTQDNRTVSAPVNIQVHASGVPAERIGQSLYDTAERYLLRTLKGAFG